MVQLYKVLTSNKNSERIPCSWPYNIPVTMTLVKVTKMGTRVLTSEKLIRRKIEEGCPHPQKGYYFIHLFATDELKKRQTGIIIHKLIHIHYF